MTKHQSLAQGRGAPATDPAAASSCPAGSVNRTPWHVVKSHSGLTAILDANDHTLLLTTRVTAELIVAAVNAFQSLLANSGMQAAALRKARCALQHGERDEALEIIEMGIEGKGRT